MKKIIITTTFVLLFANLLIGAILSFYGGLNVSLSSAVIVSTGILLFLTNTIYLKDGFRIPLMLLFAVIGFIELILSLVSPNRITDNWWLILVILLIAGEVILLIITNTISKRIN